MFPTKMKITIFASKVRHHRNQTPRTLEKIQIAQLAIQKQAAERQGLMLLWGPQLQETLLFSHGIFSQLVFRDSFDWFIIHPLLKDNNFVEGYQLFVNGGCATENNKYPQWERRQFGPDQEGSCHQYCVETQGCKYFEFEHKTGRCELHNQEITKSNGYPGVKCYKMVSGNLSFVSILGLITQVLLHKPASVHPPHLSLKYTFRNSCGKGH